MKTPVNWSPGLIAALLAVTVNAAPTEPSVPVHAAGTNSAGLTQLAAVPAEDRQTDQPQRSPDADTVNFLGQLGLIRGHLWVGSQPYRHGHHDMARTDMKDPEDELYADLVPALEARNSSGFANELSALSVLHAAADDIGAVALSLP